MSFTRLHLQLVEAHLHTTRYCSIEYLASVGNRIHMDLDFGADFPTRASWATSVHQHHLHADHLHGSETYSAASHHSHHAHRPHVHAHAHANNLTSRRRLARLSLPRLDSSEATPSEHSSLYDALPVPVPCRTSAISTETEEAEAGKDEALGRTIHRQASSTRLTFRWNAHC